MWLGPAPKRPFNRNRFHFTFRWFWDYAGGLMTDWGVHLLDYGTLVIDRNGWEVIPEKVNGQARMEAVPLQKQYGEGGLNLHAKNHLACIKTRNRNCNASVEIGAHIAKFSQLGNITYRTGKKLSWDGTSFHDAEADRYLCKIYRTPWELPKV